MIPSTSLAFLESVARAWLPRMLTSVCRDPGSPLFGCFDRDWWHYRIRDFPSIILQQGGYALYQASQWSESPHHSKGLREIAAAASRFWNLRATRAGAFEEYYPWEQGYPPLAFSTLAILKLAAEGVVPPAEIRSGASVAAQQLQTQFEAQAANQQVAGLAALAWCGKLFPDLVSKPRFEALVKQTLALQHKEGWFEEYGGPDLGYLSVTVDCLYDLSDATGDERFRESIRKAVACIQKFVKVMPGTSIGMHNSRNTDYLVPYGLFRWALESGTSAEWLNRIFSPTSPGLHFFQSVDDRYISHYIGHSVLRAILLLRKATPDASSMKASEEPECFETLTDSGHFLQKTSSGSFIATLRKGGIFTVSSGAEWASDFGWIVECEGRQFVTHWWTPDWKFGQTGRELWIEGHLYEHREVESTPWKHMALRLISRAVGRRVHQHVEESVNLQETAGQGAFPPRPGARVRARSCARRIHRAA